MLKCCLNVRGELGRGLFVCIIKKMSHHINKLRDSKHYFVLRIFYEKKRHNMYTLINAITLFF